VVAALNEGVGAWLVGGEASRPASDGAVSDSDAEEGAPVR